MLWKDEPTTPRGTEADRLQCTVVFQSSVSKLAEYHSNTQDETIHRYTNYACWKEQVPKGKNSTNEL